MNDLVVDVLHRQGNFTLEATFSAPGGVTALFGPSGSGKTTIVSLVAGLSQPQRGYIAVGGNVVLDTASRCFLPPHRRRVGYVFQDGRLFPHMSVLRNLRYGARLAPADAPRQDEAAVIELLGIGHLLDRRPAALSGGEKQRVAIGRALMSAPRLLLMDEPLASLDRARRAEILPFLERLCLHARLPIVYVTHELDEVIRLADTLVLMENGKNVACAPVRDVLGDPALQRLTGQHEASALLTADIVGGDADHGMLRLAHPAGPIFLPTPLRPVNGTIRLQVKARDVALAIGAVDGLSIRNRLACTIRRIDRLEANNILVELDAAGQRLAALITQDALADLALMPGQPVTALVKSVALWRPPSD